MLTESNTLKLTIKILKKDADFRTSREIEFIKRGTEDIQFFRDTVSKLGFNTHELLCQRMYHVFVQAGHNLFEAGSLGNTFYIILKGRVGVIINLPKPGKNELEPTEVSQLKAGESFGELSLLETQMKPRAATILCKEDSHFAVLDKKPYQEILGIAEKRDLDLKIDFMLEIDVFKDIGWTRHAVKPIILLFRHHKYSKGQIIYNEGDPSDLVMLIKSGEVKFTKKVSLNPRTAEAIILNEKSEVVTQENKPFSKVVELSVMGRHQFFGDDESILEIPRQSTATIVSSEAEIWTINKRELMKKLYLFDASYKIFVRQAKSKNKWREKRISEICQITDKKINTDMLIGSANTLRSTVHSEVQTKLNRKYYERKQAQESIENQANRAERLRESMLLLQNKGSSQPPTSRLAINSPSYIHHHPSQSDLLFYHNEPNNSELKVFLDSKMKIKDVEDKSSRVLYNTNQQRRPISARLGRGSLPGENAESTTYQAFIGGYQQENKHLSNSIDMSAIIEKNTNQNETLNIWDRLAGTTPHHENKNLTIDYANEPPRSHRGRIGTSKETELSETEQVIRMVQMRKKLHLQNMQNEALFEAVCRKWKSLDKRVKIPRKHLIPARNLKRQSISFMIE